MKLIFSIVHDDDSYTVIEALNNSGYYVTKLCSTGSFLRTGNTTLLIGINDEELDPVLEIIKANSKRRTQYIQTTTHGALPGIFAAVGTEVSVGGSTIFVINVEKMEKF